MSLYGLLSSIVWAGVALFALHRLTALVERRLGGNAAERVDPTPLPPDLKAFANKFATDWARADAEKAIRERYEQHKDWNAVRRAVGVGVMDT